MIDLEMGLAIHLRCFLELTDTATVRASRRRAGDREAPRVREPARYPANHPFVAASANAGAAAENGTRSLTARALRFERLSGRHVSERHELRVSRRDGDIFVRTLLMLISFGWFTLQGAKLGDTMLAANAVLMNFQALLAYGLDGFAHAAEPFFVKTGHEFPTHFIVHVPQRKQHGACTGDA